MAEPGLDSNYGPMGCGFPPGTLCFQVAAEGQVTFAREHQGLQGGNGHRSDASRLLRFAWSSWLRGLRRKGASSAAWTGTCPRTRTGQETELELHLPKFIRGHSAGKALWLLVRSEAKKAGALGPRDIVSLPTARILGSCSSRL